MSKITSLSQLDPNGYYTYADYLSWKFAEMVELIRGRVVRMSPAPSRGLPSERGRLRWAP